MREVAGLVAEVLEAFLLVEGEGVVDFAADIVGFHVCHEGIALVGVDDKLIIDVVVAWEFLGQEDAAVEVAGYEVINCAGESGGFEGLAV